MTENNPNRKEKKQQLTIWIKPSLSERIESLKADDNCDSKSELIEKSLEFYFGYLECKENRFFLPNALTSAMKGIVTESINKQNTLLFKIAVELHILSNIVATLNPDIDEVTLQRVRGYSTEQVKRTNGIITFEEVLRSLR